MNEQSISKKIIEDATLQAEAIINNAISEADEQRIATARQADLSVSEIEEQAKREGELLIERRKTLARLDAKKIALDCKQELLARAFEIARQKLNSLSGSDYLKFIEKQIASYAEKGDTVCICGSAPLSIAEVSALATVKELGLEVVKGASFGGGIKLLGKKTDKDLSFNAILAQFALTNAQNISAIIFK